MAVRQMSMVLTFLLCAAVASGQVVAGAIKSPEGDPRFSPAAGVKILNNLVFELLNVKSPGARAYTINNPREGWIFVSVSAARAAGRAPSVTLDSQAVPFRPVGKNLEAMRYLPEGAHTIRIGRGTADRLIVRAIGELFYSMYGVDPLVPETGHYDWVFLRKHVLDHYNSIIGQETDKYEKEIKEWTSEGKRWMTQRSLPWVKTADEAYDYWARQMGMQHPLMHGVWADEFMHGEKYVKMYPIWCEALRRLKANPKFEGRQFYAYTNSTFTSDVDPLVKTVMKCGYRLAPEWYNRELPREEDIPGNLGASFELNNRAKYEASHPGAATSRVLILALFSQPEESTDNYPHCNYNVFLDMQFHFIATQPAYFALRGLQGYYSPYAGEEQTRLFAKLVRHYAIEGRTDRMLKDPYILPHLRNPDFLQGTDEWSLSPAVPSEAEQGDSIAAKTAKGFGWLQGRNIRKDVGDSVLWTRRSSDKPNVFSQEIRHLEPGRLYSLRFFTGNYQDLLQGKSRRYRHAISVKIENVEIVPQKQFQAIIKNNYGHAFGPFNRNHRYLMNYHQRVFKARGKSARLVLSDWKSQARPGGPAGEELIWNFIQIQPYIP